MFVLSFVSYVFVRLHISNPKVVPTYSNIARMADSTADTVPVIISEPLAISTLATCTPADFIAMSAMIIAVSGGVMVSMPMADWAGLFIGRLL